MSYSLALVLGTARSGRQSEHVVHFIHQELLEKNINHTLVDVREYNFDSTVPPEGVHEGATRWREIAGKVDGFIMVIPEYNHSFPGEWKQLMDSALKEYSRKPVFLVCVSSGPFSGVRAQMALLPIFHELNMVVPRSALLVSDIVNTFSEEGALLRPELKDRFHASFKDFKWYVETLQSGRNK